MSSNVVKRDAARSLPRVEWRIWSSGAFSEAVTARAGAAQEPPPPGVTRDAAREKEAFERGFREGEASGSRKAMEQFQAAIQRFAESASSLAAYKATLRAEVERELVTLSLAVAQKIVRRELSIDPNIVLAVVRACLAELQNAEIYRLRLHPQDVQPVTEFFRQQRRTTIDIAPDVQIPRGGAVFETSQGTLDARLDTQLGEIANGLADK